MIFSKTLRRIFFPFITFVIGIALGAWFLRDTRPRSLLALPTCNNCLHPNEISGLLAAGLIQNHSGLMPMVEFETDNAIAIRNPVPQAKLHYVIFPKRDVKNLGDLGQDETPYIVEAISVASMLVQQKHLKSYRLWTNGPRTQSVGYLHFHLAGTD